VRLHRFEGVEARQRRVGLWLVLDFDYLAARQQRAQGCKQG